MRSPAVVESATSRALTCPDIILEIIEQTPHLSDDTSSSVCDRRRLLADLALVCKTFNGPATKTLWSRLDSFLPLLAIFSAFDHKNISADLAPTYVRGCDVILCLFLLLSLIIAQR